MTMLSFRVDDDEAERARAWATRTGVDRSELLRDALRRHLDHLAACDDADIWDAATLADDELALGEIADWGPAEGWEDWADATG